jgi:hypothetical protein
MHELLIKQDELKLTGGYTDPSLAARDDREVGVTNCQLSLENFTSYDSPSLFTSHLSRLIPLISSKTRNS